MNENKATIEERIKSFVQSKLSPETSSVDKWIMFNSPIGDDCIIGVNGMCEFYTHTRLIKKLNEVSFHSLCCVLHSLDNLDFCNNVTIDTMLDKYKTIWYTFLNSKGHSYNNLIKICSSLDKEASSLLQKLIIPLKTDSTDFLKYYLNDTIWTDIHSGKSEFHYPIEIYKDKVVLHITSNFNDETISGLGNFNIELVKFSNYCYNVCPFAFKKEFEFIYHKTSPCAVVLPINKQATIILNKLMYDGIDDLPIKGIFYK